MSDYKPVVPKWVAEILEREKQKDPLATIGKTKEWDEWKYRYSRKLKYARANGWIVEDSEPKLKLIVAGSRGFDDYELLKETLDKALIRFKYADVEIVSGTAKGADKLGERYAKEHGCQVKRMPADWDRYGKSAGYRRNADMAKYADACIVFWDGKSRGTKHMIDLAHREYVEYRIVRY